MKRLFAIFLTLAAIFAIAMIGNARASNADIPEPPAIGATIGDFTLPDANGASHSLASMKGKNGTVLIFVAVQCPVSNAYNERMQKLADEYQAKGINVVGINSNVAESADAVKAHAAANKMTFLILKDAGNKLADTLGATKTPEAYFLDAGNKLVYHGRIDNSKDPEGVSSNELRDALNAVLAGKPVEKPTALAFGCTIKRA
jgi:peroxiredoxin